MMRKVTNFPWLIMNSKLPIAGGNPAGVGGVCVLAKANAALLGGDAVFIQDAGEVDKSTTAADYASQCGIVVAGTKVWAGGGLWVPDDSSLVGVQVAAANEQVLVCIQGIVYGIAGEAWTAPVELAPSGAAAGRLLIDATPTAEEVIARAWGDASGAAAAALVMVGFN